MDINRIRMEVNSEKYSDELLELVIAACKNHHSNKIKAGIKAAKERKKNNLK